MTTTSLDVRALRLTLNNDATFSESARVRVLRRIGAYLAESVETPYVCDDCDLRIQPRVEPSATQRLADALRELLAEHDGAPF